MRNVITQDKDAALKRLENSLALYKRHPTMKTKMDAIAAFIGIQAIIDPVGYDRKSQKGTQKRHETRDELHELEQETFLRTLSETLHQEG